MTLFTVEKAQAKGLEHLIYLILAGKRKGGSFCHPKAPKVVVWIGLGICVVTTRKPSAPSFLVVSTPANLEGA